MHATAVRERVAFASAAIGRLETIATAVGRQIDHLREYRQALITAAVTGQIDLANMADDRDDVVQKAEANGETQPCGSR